MLLTVIISTTIVWINDSREDFLQGYVPGGIELDIYVTKEGELALPGNNWDLDYNGYPDLISINENGLNGEDACYSYIFYGGPNGFCKKILLFLPHHMDLSLQQILIMMVT